MSEDSKGDRRYAATIHDGVSVAEARQRAQTDGTIEALPHPLEASLHGVPLTPIPEPPRGLSSQPPEPVLSASEPGRISDPLTPTAPRTLYPSSQVDDSSLAVKIPTPPPAVGVRGKFRSWIHASRLGEDGALPTNDDDVGADDVDMVLPTHSFLSQLSVFIEMHLPSVHRHLVRRYRRFRGDCRRRGFLWAIAPWNLFRPIHRR